MGCFFKKFFVPKYWKWKVASKMTLAKKKKKKNIFAESLGVEIKE